MDCVTNITVTNRSIYLTVFTLVQELTIMDLLHMKQTEIKQYCSILTKSLVCHKLIKIYITLKVLSGSTCYIYG